METNAKGVKFPTELHLDVQEKRLDGEQIDNGLNHKRRKHSASSISLVLDSLLGLLMQNVNNSLKVAKVKDSRLYP